MIARTQDTWPETTLVRATARGAAGRCSGRADSAVACTSGSLHHDYHHISARHQRLIFLPVSRSLFSSTFPFLAFSLSLSVYPSLAFSLGLLLAPAAPRRRGLCVLSLPSSPPCTPTILSFASSPPRPRVSIHSATRLFLSQAARAWLWGSAREMTIYKLLLSRALLAIYRIHRLIAASSITRN